MNELSLYKERLGLFNKIEKMYEEEHSENNFKNM